jgi:hypothetical protein
VALREELDSPGSLIARNPPSVVLCGKLTKKVWCVSRVLC